MKRILLLVLAGISFPFLLSSPVKAQVVEVEPGGVVVHRHYHHHHDWEREREWRERRWREHHYWRHRHYHHDWD
jgi:hypothetical protein